MPRSQPDHLVDALTAAAYVTHVTGRHCAPGTIWSWASRGHIGRHGRGRYDIREIDTWIRTNDGSMTSLDVEDEDREVDTDGPWREREPTGRARLRMEAFGPRSKPE